MPTEVELAYLAGLFDGEGCVSAWMATGKHGWRLDALRVTIKMCDPQGIEVARRCFGGSTRWTLAKHPRRAQYVWNIASRAKAVQFLSAIRPYVRVKSDQIALALKWSMTFQGFNRLGTTKGDRQSLNVVPKAIVERRNRIALLLHQAKKKIYASE